MITAVDTSVLLDVLAADAQHGPASANALRKATADGALIASTVVFAEVLGAYEDSKAVVARLDRLGLQLVADDRDVAIAASRVYRAYRRSGGTRERILPDFLIGAHALVHADRLLTRDRGFYRSLFANLTLLQA